MASNGSYIWHQPTERQRRDRYVVKGVDGDGNRVSITYDDAKLDEVRSLVVREVIDDVGYELEVHCPNTPYKNAFIGTIISEPFYESFKCYWVTRSEWVHEIEPNTGKITYTGCHR